MMTVAEVIELWQESGMSHQLIPAGWGSDLEGFDSWLIASNMPASTRRLRQYHLRRFARAVAVPPAEVTTDLVIRYLAHPGWKANTRQSIRSSIRGFFRWATLTKRLAENPAEHVPPVRVPRGRPRPASDAALEAAMLAADERVRLMVRLGAHAGLRCCEIAKVHADDLVRDLVGWSLRVTGKGDKVRIVPLGDDLARAIREHDGYVFPGQIDGHISAEYVSRLVSRALPAGVTAHTLRHRFASRAFAGSKNLRAVQELLGHASIATTQIYTAVDDLDLREAAAAAA